MCFGTYFSWMGVVKVEQASSDLFLEYIIFCILETNALALSLAGRTGRLGTFYGVISGVALVRKG